MLPGPWKTLMYASLTATYALEANLNPVKDSIAMEPKDSPFANVLTLRPEDKDKESIKELGAALQSPEVKKFLEELTRAPAYRHFNF